MGEARKDAIRVNFDRSLRLELHGSTISSDGGLLAYRELDEAFALTAMADEVLTELRTGWNVQHSMRALLRRGGGEKSPLSEVMTSPVIAVVPDLHITQLVPMLSSQGLHCLPVVEQGRLVGMVTQTDLIAALQRSMLMTIRAGAD